MPWPRCGQGTLGAHSAELAAAALEQISGLISLEIFVILLIVLIAAFQPESLEWGRQEVEESISLGSLGRIGIVVGVAVMSTFVAGSTGAMLGATCTYGNGGSYIQ